MTTMPLRLATRELPHEGTAPFSQRLRASSAGAHESAEGSRFLHRLLTGELDRDAYALLAVQHFGIYRALESVAPSLSTDPIAGAFVDERLDRLSHLRADLEFFYGPRWRERLTILPATWAYAERIGDIGAKVPQFVAHHYVRYLGDLSGGLAIARIVARTHGLTLGEQGLLFHHFDQIPTPKTYKDAYRASLDDAPFTPEEQADVLEEVLLAYQLNSAVFADLDAATGGA